MDIFNVRIQEYWLQLSVADSVSYQVILDHVIIPLAQEDLVAKKDRAPLLWVCLDNLLIQFLEHWLHILCLVRNRISVCYRNHLVQNLIIELLHLLVHLRFNHVIDQRLSFFPVYVYKQGISHRINEVWEFQRFHLPVELRNPLRLAQLSCCFPDIFGKMRELTHSFVKSLCCRWFSPYNHFLTSMQTRLSR